MNDLGRACVVALASRRQILLFFTAVGELGSRELMGSEDILVIIQLPPTDGSRYCTGGAVCVGSKIFSHNEWGNCIKLRPCLIRHCAKANGLVRHFYKQASNEAK